MNKHIELFYKFIEILSAMKTSFRSYNKRMHAQVFSWSIVLVCVCVWCNSICWNAKNIRKISQFRNWKVFLDWVRVNVNRIASYFMCSTFFLFSVMFSIHRCRLPVNARSILFPIHLTEFALVCVIVRSPLFNRIAFNSRSPVAVSTHSSLRFFDTLF